MTGTDKMILVLDEGTTSTRAILYDAAGQGLGTAQQALTQHYPAPGVVEHDAQEIWDATLACARAMIDKAGGADRIAAIGITNQRETVAAWDRRTGQPICRAIVWQDRRTEAQCRQLREQGHEDRVQRETGLLLDPYFSATKMRWIMDHVPQARELGDRLAMGTIESWLVWKLTGGLHVSDATNASRTLLLPLEGRDWDGGLCDLFDVPRSALGDIVPCTGSIAATDSALFGRAIPITGLAGDQQSASIGQACFARGECKATMGTGAFILANAGSEPPRSGHRLLGTVLWDTGDERIYALEGSVFAAGSIFQWLRDGLALLSQSAESEALARSVKDSGGVVFVPGLAGLGAPYWDAEATASLSGMSFATTRAHVVRAALESIAHVLCDLKTAFAADGAAWSSLRIDGGMSANDWLAQDLADMLAIPCERPADIETTARGAAMLAAFGAGLYTSLEDTKAMASPATAFRPRMDSGERETRLRRWHAALPAQVSRG